jgi:hypothetical protein
VSRLSGERFDRLVELRNWLRGLGCCVLCAIEMAWAQMWRESVDGTYRLTRPPGCPRHTKPDCYAVAREHWRTMPPVGIT